MALLFGETSERLSTLPPFQLLPNQPATEKPTIALQFLSEAAIARRQSQSQKFYSIRAVTKHFSPPWQLMLYLRFAICDCKALHARVTRKRVMNSSNRGEAPDKNLVTPLERRDQS